MIDALALLRDFAALQDRLVRTFLETAVPVDVEYFRDVPDGVLSVDGSDWAYNKHGRGVRFTCQDGRVVDVHVGLCEHPRAITAWRLEQYLESIGVDEVLFEGVSYSSHDEAELERLLLRVERAGAVRSAGGRMFECVPVRGVKS